MPKVSGCRPGYSRFWESKTGDIVRSRLPPEMAVASSTSWTNWRRTCRNVAARRALLDLAKGSLDPVARGKNIGSLRLHFGGT